MYFELVSAVVAALIVALMFGLAVLLVFEAVAKLAAKRSWDYLDDSLSKARISRRLADLRKP